MNTYWETLAAVNPSHWHQWTLTERLLQQWTHLTDINEHLLRDSCSSEPISLTPMNTYWETLAAVNPSHWHQWTLTERLLQQWAHLTVINEHLLRNSCSSEPISLTSMNTYWETLTAVNPSHWHKWTLTERLLQQWTHLTDINEHLLRDSYSSEPISLTSMNTYWETLAAVNPSHWHQWTLTERLLQQWTHLTDTNEHLLRDSCSSEPISLTSMNTYWETLAAVNPSHWHQWTLTERLLQQWTHLTDVNEHLLRDSCSSEPISLTSMNTYWETLAAVNPSHWHQWTLTETLAAVNPSHWHQWTLTERLLQQWTHITDINEHLMRDSCSSEPISLTSMNTYWETLAAVNPSHWHQWTLNERLLQQWTHLTDVNEHLPRDSCSSEPISQTSMNTYRETLAAVSPSHWHQWTLTERLLQQWTHLTDVNEHLPRDSCSSEPISLTSMNTYWETLAAVSPSHWHQWTLTERLLQQWAHLTDINEHLLRDSCSSEPISMTSMNTYWETLTAVNPSHWHQWTLTERLLQQWTHLTDINEHLLRDSYSSEPISLTSMNTYWETLTAVNPSHWRQWTLTERLLQQWTHLTDINEHLLRDSCSSEPISLTSMNTYWETLAAVNPSHWHQWTLTERLLQQWTHLTDINEHLLRDSCSSEPISLTSMNTYWETLTAVNPSHWHQWTFTERLLQQWTHLTDINEHLLRDSCSSEPISLTSMNTYWETLAAVNPSHWCLMNTYWETLAAVNPSHWHQWTLTERLLQQWTHLTDINEHLLRDSYSSEPISLTSMNTYWETLAAVNPSHWHQWTLTERLLQQWTHLTDINEHLLRDSCSSEPISLTSMNTYWETLTAVNPSHWHQWTLTERLLQQWTHLTDTNEHLLRDSCSSEPISLTPMNTYWETLAAVNPSHWRQWTLTERLLQQWTHLTDINEHLLRDSCSSEPISLMSMNTYWETLAAVSPSHWHQWTLTERLLQQWTHLTDINEHLLRDSCSSEPISLTSMNTYWDSCSSEPISLTSMNTYWETLAAVNPSHWHQWTLNERLLQQWTHLTDINEHLLRDSCSSEPISLTSMNT